jgi:hypothetical protein
MLCSGVYRSPESHHCASSGRHFGAAGRSLAIILHSVQIYGVINCSFFKQNWNKIDQNLGANVLLQKLEQSCGRERLEGFYYNHKPRSDGLELTS